jgi:hypothetical protein
MTGSERNEIADLRAELLPRLDAIESRLDRWDGAITFIKAASSFLGFGGLLLILTALLSVGR